MEKYLELITEKDDIISSINLALKTFIKSETSRYNKEELKEKTKILSELDIFQVEYLEELIGCEAVDMYAIKDKNKIVACIALDVSTGRILFIAADGTDNVRQDYYLYMVRQLEKDYMEDRLTPTFTIMAYYGEAKLLEKVGFYKLKSYIEFNGIYFAPMKLKTDQYDNEIY